MAKGKSANPADAYRKAQRKKELKKNKADRAKARDFSLVKKDTRDLEDDIAKLEASSEPSGTDKARLAELKSELVKITKKKEDYVQEHPEHRKLVFKSRRPEGSRDAVQEENVVPKSRNLFKKNGLPRHPERSIYYDAVLNPFGVPPPGMPYIERPLLPDEVKSDVEEESDNDIALPEGPPPADEEENSDDDIPMPEGPPPSVPAPLPIDQSPMPPLVLQPPSVTMPPPLPFAVPPPPGMPMLPQGGSVPPPPPLPMGMFPPPPLGFPTSLPPPPQGFLVNPLPPGMPFPPFPPGHMQQSPMPPPPPGFYPRKGTNTRAMQDPLSSIPHQTFQAHRAAKATGPSTLPQHASLPAKPTSGGVRLGPSTSPPAPSTSAVISAEPVLRDFKKEATAFVPATLKRKKAGGSKVNAAPAVDAAGEYDADEPAPASRPDLLSTLQGKFGAPPSKRPKLETAKDGKPQNKDDYGKFLEEMSDILGPTNG
ncbi:WW domain binding protein 11-domain-containing protein [Epithele typhae]|uniref:WW domain binding protein 11-domain-containing protein n=1 Tax=Epithele typhae TaxID=378194 RepID=UPI002008CC5C|nr:WW domain binding protein 11-domain-containing protein [Epithele typhae]KAH9944012.1 WW domain binding protein 11-domain-containing protein [Epithele typhae]